MTNKIYTVSVIIPVYNEENVISACIESLVKQSFPIKEIIIVDDGSKDNSVSKIKKQKSKIKNVTLLQQTHKGSGAARNLGVSRATGDILVFVDADMTFDQRFIEKLTQPIMTGVSNGTFTKEEYVSNWNNFWARCWNYNENIAENRRVPKDHPDISPVFRAILRSEFERVGGFDDIGFTDDWTLSRKFSYQATVAKGAICYHQNPQDLHEIFVQAQWIGKNEFISGSMILQIANLIRYNSIIQLFRGINLYFKFRQAKIFIFLLVYSLGIQVGIVKRLLGQDKNR